MDKKEREASTDDDQDEEASMGRIFRSSERREWDKNRAALGSGSAGRSSVDPKCK